MNDNEINIAIAEACGWTKCYKGCEGRTWRNPQDTGCQPNLPDYLNDLNAMHEAERIVLGYDEVQKYKRVLNKVCGPKTHPIFSDAAQRAEAFLRTLGKWKD